MIRLTVSDVLHDSTVLIDGIPRSVSKPSRIRFTNQSLRVKAQWRSSAMYVHGHERTRDSLEPTIYLSPYVQQTLRLPTETRLSAVVRSDEWILGPCLGLYASVSLNQARLFGEQTGMFQDMVRMGMERGVDVIVMAPGVLKNQMGWRYDVNRGEWANQSIPTPDIVLRRSGTFRTPWVRVNEELSSFASAGKLHTLPRTVSNKWAFYRELRNVTDLKAHLPSSHLAQSSTDVWKLFLTYKDIYVKPLAGAQGVSVYRIVTRKNGAVALWEERTPLKSVERGKRTVLSTHVRERALQNQSDFLKFWRQTGLRRCIVQETIELPRTNDDQPFDFRWLVQSTDEPHVIARVARVGRPQSVTTNIHTGGQAVDVQQVLGFTPGNGNDKLLSKLDHVALNVAETLRERHGPFAELGVDLALRRDGRIVVFEVNPTPGRRMLRSLSGDVREMSLECLLEYAIRATGFYTLGTE